MESKGGVSPIVASVLLILLVIVAIAAVWVWVMPLFSGNIEQKEVCLDTLKNLYFENFCHYPDPNFPFGTIFTFDVRVGPKPIDLADLQMVIYMSGGDTSIRYLSDDSGHWGTIGIGALDGPNSRVTYKRDTIASPNDIDAEKVGIAPIIRYGDTNITCEPLPALPLGPC